MTPKGFVWLAIAAVAMTALAVLSWSSRNDWRDAVVTGEKLMPALIADPAKVAGLEVTNGDKTLKLARSSDGKGWVLPERSGYPVETEKVRALVVKLSESELVEPKTKLADRYALIDLGDPTKAEAKSRLVRLMAADGKPIAEAILGRTRMDAFGSGKVGTYVRRPGEAQSWLATGEMEPSASVSSWVNTSLLNRDAAKFTKLTLTVSGEAPLVAERKEGKASFVDLKVPEGKKLKDENAADTLMRAAGTLDLTDVRKLDAASSAAEASVLEVEAGEGLKYTLRLRKDGKDDWVSIVATGEGETGTKAAETINAKAKGWEFQISPVKAGALIKRRADLFADSSS